MWKTIYNRDVDEVAWASLAQTSSVANWFQTKEALACGCPIVSVDVGDVRERTKGVEGCYVADSRHPQDLAELLHKALLFEGKTHGREKVIADKLDNESVAHQLIGIYNKVLKK